MRRMSASQLPGIKPKTAPPIAAHSIQTHTRFILIPPRIPKAALQADADAHRRPLAEDALIRVRHRELVGRTKFDMIDDLPSKSDRTPEDRRRKLSSD